jgi:hypothetical protein
MTIASVLLKSASVLLTSVALASQILPAFAADDAHAGYLATVASYKPMAGFNHLIGATRFVGYFLPAPDACKVTVFEAAADDETLATPPRRIDVVIAAGDRSEFAAGDGSALAIACAVDADAIRIAPQHRTTVSLAPASAVVR